MLTEIKKYNGSNHNNGGGRFAFEKDSQIRKYQDFNVQPDYHIDSFYLTTSLFTAQEVGFPGNHLSVLNSFIPGNLEGFSLYYHTDQQSRNVFTTTVNQVNPKTFPVFGSMNYEVQFNKLYRTLTMDATDSGPVQISNTTFSFTQNLNFCTPILVMFGRDVRPIVNESFKSDNFKYNFVSVIPTSAVAGDTSIKVFHGWNDLTKICITANTVVNNITVLLQQKDHLATFQTDFTVVIPPGTGYQTIFTMPERVSNEIRILVTGGGGVGETGSIEFDVLFSARG